MVGPSLISTALSMLLLSAGLQVSKASDYTLVVLDDARNLCLRAEKCGPNERVDLADCHENDSLQLWNFHDEYENLVLKETKNGDKYCIQDEGGHLFLNKCDDIKHAISRELWLGHGYRGSSNKNGRNKNLQIGFGYRGIADDDDSGYHKKKRYYNDSDDSGYHKKKRYYNDYDDSGYYKKQRYYHDDDDSSGGCHDDDDSSRYSSGYHRKHRDDDDDTAQNVVVVQADDDDSGKRYGDDDDDDSSGGRDRERDRDSNDYKLIVLKEKSGVCACVDAAKVGAVVTLCDCIEGNRDSRESKLQQWDVSSTSKKQLLRPRMNRNLCASPEHGTIQLVECTGSQHMLWMYDEYYDRLLCQWFSGGNSCASIYKRRRRSLRMVQGSSGRALEVGFSRTRFKDKTDSGGNGSDGLYDGVSKSDRLLLTDRSYASAFDIVRVRNYRR